MKYSYYGETPQTEVIVGFDASSDTVRVMTSGLDSFFCSSKEINSSFNEYCISSIIDNGMLDEFKKKIEKEVYSIIPTFYFICQYYNILSHERRKKVEKVRVRSSSSRKEF